jgi:hypothetical protein
LFLIANQRKNLHLGGAQVFHNLSQGSLCEKKFRYTIYFIFGLCKHCGLTAILHKLSKHFFVGLYFLKVSIVLLIVIFILLQLWEDLKVAGQDIVHLANNLSSLTEDSYEKLASA